MNVKIPWPIFVKVQHIIEYYIIRIMIVRYNIHNIVNTLQL